MTSRAMYARTMPSKFRSLTIVTDCNEHSARKKQRFLAQDSNQDVSRYLRCAYVCDRAPRHAHCSCGKKSPLGYSGSEWPPLPVQLAGRVVRKVREDSLASFQ